MSRIVSTTKAAGLSVVLAALPTTATLGQVGPNGRPTTQAAPWGDVLPVSDGRHSGIDGSTNDGMGPGVQAAGDAIALQQCIDGGWAWPSGACPGTSPQNTVGPIAMGLLRAWEITGDPALLNSAIAGAGYNLTYQYGNGEARFGAFEAYFLQQLSIATGDPQYADHAANEFYAELDASTYGPSDLNTAGWINAVNVARTGTWVNLRPWEFSNQIPAVTALGTPAQVGEFINLGLLAGLDTLDNTNPGAVFTDIIGVAGAVRGLAFGSVLAFPAVNAPLHPGVNGITGLCDLADYLASLQNANGSWNWHSNLASPDVTDEDTQVTAYAILGLMEAENAGCGSYQTAIAKGRAWLDTMQVASGQFKSWSGDTTYNTEVDGEALSAMAIETLTLNGISCDNSGFLTVTIDMATMPNFIVGGQFFLSYDNVTLTFVSAEPGDAALSDPFNPFELEVFEFVDAGAGTIGYAVGVTGGDPGTMDATTMAVLTFSVNAQVCDTADLVTFRPNMPPTRLTDILGLPILPTWVNLGGVTLDWTAPAITCPADVTIECDASSLPANTGTASATDACDVAPLIASTDVVALGGCNGTGTITRTWTATDDCGNVSSCDQVITVQDTTAPDVSGCPSDIMGVSADAGFCSAVVSWTEPTATDTCGTPVISSQSHFPGDIFAVGTTTVTYIFEDDCGNTTPCSFDVEVLGTSELDFTVDLMGSFSTDFTRCITIELGGVDSATVSIDVDFFSGAGATTTVLVPCGDYDCATIRDSLHTLASSVGMGTSGTNYITSAVAGDALVPGNLNDDAFIDILDFGTYVGQFADLLSPDTLCGTLAPHSDIDGNGSVFVSDFTFISANFLMFSDSGCTPMPLDSNGAFVRNGRLGTNAPKAGPVTRISTKELRQRGLFELIRADLTGDGWLDQDDIVAFLNGARP